MDWERAKNIVIVFFLMINIMLSYLIYQNNRKYTLDAESESTIVELLANNNISLYTRVLSSYEPMRNFELTYKPMDEDRFKAIFFNGQAPVLVDSQEGLKQFELEGMVLRLYENMASFENVAAEEKIELNLDNAKQICDEFITGMGDLGNGFELDIAPYFRGGEIIVEYRQQIDKIVIYNNYILFAVDRNGLR
ncbi:MAG: hypothetical protein LBU94_05280, partial [Clostridiales bacterium]|nr:hypothetical protein [Clostridiales bacterium]